MTTRRSGKGRNGASWGWRTCSLAHPRLLSKPFVLDATDRAIGAGKENRHGAEALRFSFIPSRDLAPRLRASDHDSSHPGLLRWERLRVASILAGYESRLTAARQSRGKCKKHYRRNPQKRQDVSGGRSRKSGGVALFAAVLRIAAKVVQRVMYYNVSIGAFVQ